MYLKNLLMCVKGRGIILLCVTCRFYLHSKLAFCLATNGTLGDFAYHLFCVIFVILNMTKITQNRIIFQYVFVVTFEKFNNHKNITVFEKDSVRLLKIIIISIFQRIACDACKYITSHRMHQKYRHFLPFKR